MLVIKIDNFDLTRIIIINIKALSSKFAGPGVGVVERRAAYRPGAFVCGRRP